MQTLSKLWKRGCDFLGSDTAIICGAMTWVSNHQLVCAVSNAGGFGVIASGAMEPHMLDEEIKKTKSLTNKAFGVNIITMHPKILEMIEVCKKHNVSHVILAGGLPDSQSVKKIKEYGAKIIGFAPAVIIAKKLVKMGFDALIIEGNEAGGHIGPVSTNVLAQEILPVIKEVPVFIAGGIGRGENIAAFLQMGASGCQLGTRFVCAVESPAHDNFKQSFIKAQSRDAIVSVQLDSRFPVIPVRFLANRAYQEFLNFQAQTIKQVEANELSLKEGQLKIEHYWAGSLRKAVIDGDVEQGSLMAGQSVGMVDKIEPAKQIIDNLINQACNFLQAQDA